MLKTRIIPVLLYKDTGLVKGTGFNSWRRVGPALPAVNIHDLREVDELIFLDIGCDEPDFDLLRDVSDACFMPLTVGGGVSELDHFRELLLAGADKVAINSAAVRLPSLLETASRKFGSQCVTVSIDVLEGEVVIDRGCSATGLSPLKWARTVEKLGAGEILLNSVERDGTMQGYDLELIRTVSNAVNIPVVACGGAGTYEHFAEGLRAGAHSVAAGAVFQFTERTPGGAATYLDGQGFPVRIVRPDNGGHGDVGTRAGSTPAP